MERELKKFDLNTKFGPCVGIKRSIRWQRAKTLNLNPPDYLLKYFEINDESCWDKILCVK